MEAYEDLYIREEKNPMKRKSKLSILLKFLLPLILIALVALMVFQFITLAKLDNQVEATVPDGQPASVEDTPTE